MKKRWAILDLGTNTFHLMIADIINDQFFDVIFKAEEFVQLGENGLEQIGEKPFRRGIEQIKKYRRIIDEYQPQQIIGFGTAAIRSAKNGDEFISAIKAICPMELRKISGDEEAEFIYLGVKQAVPLASEKVLIMDIGGGSTEFIIADQNRIHWKESFPVGASVLKQKFHHHEPVTSGEIAELNLFLTEKLKRLIAQSNHFTINHIVGASGSFDTFAALIGHQFFTPDVLKSNCFSFSPDHFQFVHGKLVKSNLQQRLQMKGMIAFRAEMMVVASILTAFVIDQFPVQAITRSAYALKEGALYSMIHQPR